MDPNTPQRDPLTDTDAANQTAQGSPQPLIIEDAPSVVPITPEPPPADAIILHAKPTDSPMEERA